MTRSAYPRVLARLVPWLLVGLLCAPWAASAQTRAWLDRAQVALGDTVTLNIQSDSSASPDLAPLGADF